MKIKTVKEPRSTVLKLQIKGNTLQCLWKRTYIGRGRRQVFYESDTFTGGYGSITEAKKDTEKRAKEGYWGPIIQSYFEEEK